MTVSPRRGPGGMAIFELAAAVLVVLGLGQELLVGAESGLALGLAGLGRQPDPLQLAGQRALAGVDDCFDSRDMRSSFCSSQLE